MDIEYCKRILISFIRVFVVLFAILVLLPWIVDQVMHYISGGVPPGNDSIRVFKDFVAEKGGITRFLESLKKVIFFM